MRDLFIQTVLTTKHGRRSPCRNFILTRGIKMEEEQEVKIDDEKVKAEVDIEMDKLIEREKAIFERAGKLKSVHEDLVHIHRYGHIDTLTYLHITEQQMRQRRQSSWYGKIVKISEIE